MLSKLDLKDLYVSDPRLMPLFSEPPHDFLLSKAVRWQFAKARLGVRATKGISDIKATTKKPYRQKGTGRARHGSLCSPQFRGGAVIFGPVKRNHSFSMNKKERARAVRVALSQRFRDGALFFVDGSFDAIGAKAFSSLMASLLPLWQEVGQKILFVGDFGNDFLLSSRSFYNVDVLKPEGLNVRDILGHRFVFLHLSSLDSLIGRLCR